MAAWWGARSMDDLAFITEKRVGSDLYTAWRSHSQPTDTYICINGGTPFAVGDLKAYWASLCR